LAVEGDWSTYLAMLAAFESIVTEHGGHVILCRKEQA